MGISEQLLVLILIVKVSSIQSLTFEEKYPIEKLKECLLKEPLEPLICENCKKPVKPDVVLFGEKLSTNIMESIPLIKEADLVMVLGTSLKVAPFNLLVSVINKNTPTVLINFEDVMTSKTNLNKFLFLQGDIDTHVRRIVKDCGWELN